VTKWKVYYGTVVVDASFNRRKPKMGADIHITLEYSDFNSTDGNP
jgi:hypothetical protein